MHKHRHVHECASYMRMGPMRNGHGARHAAIRSRDGGGGPATTRHDAGDAGDDDGRRQPFLERLPMEGGHGNGAAAAMDDELFELTRRLWSDSPMLRSRGERRQRKNK